VPARWHSTDPRHYGISVANGLAISPDGRRLYFADAPTRRIEFFDLEAASGELSNRTTFAELPPDEGFVDGATVDAQGAYWLANGGVYALRPGVNGVPEPVVADRAECAPWLRPTVARAAPPDRCTAQ
jgi:sugar lactone lactonase YvrE